MLPSVKYSKVWQTTHGAKDCVEGSQCVQKSTIFYVTEKSVHEILFAQKG